jgi:predicted esterase
MIVVPSMARSPVLKLPAATGSETLKAGTTNIDGVGIAYIPAAPAAPAPLLLLFHGAGMKASEYMDGMKQEADRCGCAMLAIQSQGPTWDLITALGQAQRKRRNQAGAIEFGSDAGRVERGIAQMLARTSIDRTRIIPVGFSDGASYALSLSVANPRLFRSTVAIAPGFVMPPPRMDITQRLFIAHGKTDRVLPFDAARAAVVAPLEQAGYDLRFKPFEGGHFIDRQSLRDGIDFAIGPKD